MRRTSQLLLTLDEEDGAIHRRLYLQMRRLILDGTWRAGTRLPSSRALAEELGVSRNTALHAIDLLVADGWAEPRRGSAIVVTRDAPAPSRQEATLEAMAEPVPFEMARQTTQFFPLDRWNRIQSAAAAETDPAILYGAPAAGLPALRSAIADHLRAARGLAVDPRRIVIVSSTGAAIDLVARILLRPGDKVWIEDPGYPMVRQLLHTNGLQPVSVPVDSNGIDVAAGRAAAPDARLACVTPACQFPTGRILSADRRRELLAWASDRNAWIVEDDWEWHAHFGPARPPRPLQALPGGERVIYVQTFSRTVFPGLRLAALVAPEGLLEGICALHEQIHGGPHAPLQAAFAQFLGDGLYAAHLRMTRAAYARRRAALIDALQDLPPGFAVDPERGGLHLVVRAPAGTNDAALAAGLRAAGIACMGLSEFGEGSTEPGLVLGFAAFPEPILRQAAAALVTHLGAR